ncbi:MULTISPECIES: XdhC family protein [Thermomonospora]|uniref:XdhC Rossmann domain-containing protein n=1 Tax=Thermomonospora curvata (strain ATCC 19995 / DSM 43183 / JCM 3096 / KCTC 9072 / NBRC 15933 / NCIMB 10081 / Henssen B9) TaxID=471852 RepID=D1A7Z5_THECD|nr:MULTISPECIES: XdhC family protein [Thermomonospora]ACY98517.1 conserved hypothetical protein [Thermomonospora curvata DSM 43183]PKK13658.1 MAG: xanthine dehydrogenase [Thermomonospora sp. CIF 1]
MTHVHNDPACAVAHGEVVPDTADRTLVAVFATPVAEFLLRYGADLGFRTLLLEPDASRASGWDGPKVITGPTADIDERADIVVTDHHRPELGPVLRDLLAVPSRWIGVMGGARHPAPHVAELRRLGVAEGDIARVHRPIGLNIGSRTPAEIAVATLAGLLADRNGRPGGFAF